MNKSANANKKKSLFVMTCKRVWHDPTAMIGLIGAIVMIILAILAPVICKYTPTEMDLMAIKQAPSATHIFGTDELGRDVFARCIYGGRYSIALGIMASGLSIIIGVVLGSLAGYYAGAVDVIIMRFCDIIQSIPAMVISIIVSLVLGNGYIVTVFALAFGGFTFSTWLMRGQVLSVRTAEYLDAARTINCSSGRIMFKHILPNTFSPLLLQFTMQISHMIQLSASLSVVGLGVQPPTPEWGAMLSSGRNLMTNYPHLVIFPGLCIFLISLLVNMFGDGLRDALDPKLKK